MGVDLVEVLCVAVVIFSLPALSTSDPLYVMSAPNLLRVGTPEKVFVEAQDYSGDNLDVILTVKDFPKQARVIDTRTVNLSAANNYQALAEINIAHLRDLGVEDADEKIFVYLQATFKELTLEKIVLLSFQSGYIFVQTDKTIYTPASTVRYRIFSLSPALKPVVSGISVEVMTPDQITISRQTLYSDKGVRSGEIKLPDIASFGIWKVVTRFQNAPQKNYTTQFELKAYVLPSYEVTLIPKAPFFYVDDDDLTVDILARYLYGREVTGIALVMFGVFTKDNMKKSLPDSLKRVEIREGKGVAMLTKEQIIKTFPEINQLVGSSLYIKVTVLTDNGNEIVEAEKQDIKIVTSPYTINFKATPKYFKPGMPFDLSVYVSNPDNLPVKGIAIEVVTAADGTVHATTTENGMAKVTVNTLDKENTLFITVRTKVPELPEARQAELNMTASAYRTTGDSKNYLHIGVPSAELTIGQQIKMSLYVGESPGIKNEQDFTYLILNKGQLVRADRFKRKGQAVVTLSFPVTKDMIPSFRIVAYYHVGSTEVVSDSVWVDVKDTCMGKLKVELADPKKVYAPHNPFSLSITGDPEARVGLVAVDKGVYVLNNKHRLTQRKIWDVVEKLDIGCTAGSGKDSMGVFYDAGLVFESNTAGGTNSRMVHTCSPPVTRHRRFASSVDMHLGIVQQYKDESLQRCCGEGLHEDLVGRSCEVRAEYVSGKDCQQAFLRCCQELSELKQRTQDSPTERLIFPRTHSTTTIKKISYMKDSVTTWEIMAISLSENHGMCIADPLELAVTKMFFIDLRLPYSAKRGEQLEIKAILHNNNMYNTIQVRVELMEAEHVCSIASKRGSYKTMVEMEAMTSHDVSFVIIPMELGTHTIEVKAAVQNVMYGDGVKKELRVVPEGVLTKVQVNKVALNPNLHGGQQRSEIKFEHLRRQVPNTPASTHIRVQGQELSDIIVAPISGESMASLLKIPYGNGEQNLVTMAISVIATHYLDLTNQWDRVGLYKREVAVKYIKMGYQQQRSFHKRDGSYSADKKMPSSTWFTAFVVRVLSMSESIITIEEDMVCSALQWLVYKTQQADGTFKESAPVSSVKDSTGNVYGKDSDASLTAYVLIAIQDGKRICPGMIKRLEDSMRKASEYLHLRIHTLTSPYAVAIVSYALADSEKLHKDILLQHSLDGGPVWPVPGSHQYTLEATAYALMALLRMREFDLASDLVLWLHKQRRIQGGYGSTQSTVIVYQAVAEYRRSMKMVHEINLDVNIDVSGRSKPIRWTFNKGNSYISRSDKLQIDQELTVTAKGNGEATLSVMTLYYAPPSDEDKACNNFKLNLTLEKQAKASHDGAIASYILKMDVMYMSKDNDADLSVLSIGKLTGFEVDMHDLNRMSSAKERYILRFEVDNILSQGGSLLIYLNKVSHNRPDTIAFKIHKMMDVGLLQPAAVTVYKYYDNESRCVRFYHPEKLDGSLHRLCHGDICRCAEENCSVQKKEGNKNERDFEACDAGMDYVYKVTVENTNFTTSTDVYFMNVIQVVKEGSDFGVLGATRVFVGHPSCRKGLDLKKGRSYLLIGHRKDLTRVDKSVQYVLGHRTWVEYWPTEAESKEEYTSLQKFAQDLSEWGCRY